MVSKQDNVVFHVISHTHWDREWYCSFQNFRTKLVKLVDNLLDLMEQDKGFKYFHMDAQTLILKDYLEIRPENEKRLRKLIKSGRILIGPWYVQNDENLVSGESTIRNLLYGAKLCRKFETEPMEIGYLPDQFGHISQIPQILQGFDIDNFISGRGFDAHSHKTVEFEWKGPDGSRLLGISLPFWYNNAQRFPEKPEHTVKILKRIKDNFKPIATTRHLLLMNGVDHLEAQENLSWILASVAPLLENGDVIIHSTFPDYVKAAKEEIGNLATFEGELREGVDGSILASTLSTRVYLKQMNDKCELLLEKWAEPTKTWTHMAHIPNTVQSYLDLAWMTLMQNHAHDSICGCSIDRVHKDMLQRFSTASEIAEEVCKENLEQLNSLIDKDGFCSDDILLAIYNPAAARSNQVIEASIPFLYDDKVQTFAIIGPDGEDVEYELVDKANIAMVNTDPINLPVTHKVINTQVRFVAKDLPAYGYASYKICPHKAGKVMKVQDNTNTCGNEMEIETKMEIKMENEFLRVTFNPNGSINLFDKESNKTFTDLLLFEDTGEAGDSYIHIDPPDNKIYTTHKCNAKISKLVDSSLVQTFAIDFDWELPKEISRDRRTRSNETVTCKIHSELTLKKNSRLLEIKTIIDNRAKDHRLRILFPTNLDTDHSWAGSQFDIVKRHWSYGSEWNRSSNIHPNHKFVDINDSSTGLAVINLGLHEYELLGDAQRTLALTLLRCTDLINTTGQIDSFDPEYIVPDWVIPDAQCLGNNEFNYAIYPHKGDHLTAKTYQMTEQHLAGLNVVTMPLNKRKWIDGRPWVQDKEIDAIFLRPDPLASLPRLPRKKSFLELFGDDLLISAVKTREQNDNLIIRIFNVSDEKRDARLVLGSNIKNAYLVNLAENRIGKPDYTENTVAFDVGPKKIITIELELT